MISPFALPITETTLSELDIASIVNSPGHQYDVSYNADLCFRPNLDGNRRHQAGGSFLPSTLDAARRMEEMVYYTRKIHARSDMDFYREEYSARSPFWNTLQKNLQYLDYPRVAVWVAGDCVLRMLNDMKEILEALIPHRSAIINESLDIQPLMLQIFWGTEGFEECVLWLRDILKQHCAPMRHEMVNEMCIMLSEGLRERDCQILVAGFQSLFSLLWTMESDVDRYNLLTSRITSLSRLASPVSMPLSSYNKRAAVNKSYPSQKSALASMRSMRTISDMAIGKPFIMALPDSGADICYISPETATSLALRPEPGAKKPAQVSKWSIPGKAMGKAITALPDSGADACYISPETAMSLGLRPEPGTKRPVKLANGRMIVSPGAVNVPWSFLREKQTFHLTCWILPGCSHPIILGSKFLEETKCLTTRRHRIRRRYVPISKSVCVNLIGEGKQRLNGFLNDDLVAALPDTGSDVMVISLDYARRRGLKIDTGLEGIVEVEFADGATALTEGVVRNAVWSSGGHSIRCDFLVLDDLSVDVILSKDYLFDMDIFSTCQAYLTKDDDLEHLDVYGIRLVRVFGETFGRTLDQLEDDSIEDVISQDAFSHAMVNREWARRDRIRDEIEALDGNKRTEAEAAEILRQEQWERARVEHRQRWTRVQTPNQLSASTIERHGRPQLTPQRESPAASNSGVNVPPDQLGRLDNASRRLRWPKRVHVSIPLLPLRRNSSPHPP